MDNSECDIEYVTTRERRYGGTRSAYIFLCGYKPRSEGFLFGNLTVVFSMGVGDIFPSLYELIMFFPTIWFGVFFYLFTTGLQKPRQ